MEASTVGDTFFVRTDPSEEYSFFWDIWANIRTLRGYRIGVIGAHRSLGCQHDCLLNLPSAGEMERLQDRATEYVAACCTDTKVLNEWSLDCLLRYNDMYYRFMECAARHC